MFGESLQRSIGPGDEEEIEGKSVKDFLDKDLALISFLKQSLETLERT
jgi:hypothetical protein